LFARGITGSWSYSWAWVLLTFNELVFGVIAEIAARHKQAIRRPNRMGLWQVLPHATRLLGLGALLLLDLSVDLETWIVMSSAIGGTVAVASLKEIPFARTSMPSHAALMRVFKSSVHYSSGGVAIRVMGEIDKPLITRLFEPATAGGLSLAQRIVELASLPLQAVIAMSLPRLVAADSRSAATSLWIRAAVVPMIYAIASGALVAVAARPISALFGSGYSDMIWALQWMAWLPALSFLRGMLSNALALLQLSSDYAAGHWLGAVTRLGTCTALLWLMGWKGAVLSLALSECAVSSYLAAKLLAALRNRTPQILREISAP